MIFGTETRFIHKRPAPRPRKTLFVCLLFHVTSMAAVLNTLMAKFHKVAEYWEILNPLTVICDSDDLVNATNMKKKFM